MATVKFNPNEQIKNKEQSEVSDTTKGTKAYEADQRVHTAPKDRSHTAAVMDTDKAP